MFKMLKWWTSPKCLNDEQVKKCDVLRLLFSSHGVLSMIFGFQTRQQPASGWREALETRKGVIQHNYVPWRAIEMRVNRRSLKTGNTTQDPLFSKSSKKFKKMVQNGSRKHAPLKPNHLLWGFCYQPVFLICQITEGQQHCFFMSHLHIPPAKIAKIAYKQTKQTPYFWTIPNVIGASRKS